MTTVRRGLASTGAAIMLAFAVLPTGGVSAAVQRELSAEGRAVSFAVRPTYDSGGASPLHIFIGYADANVATPPATADGQASWYNLNIVETAAFKPPEDCTPQRNLKATQDGVADVQAWADEYIQTIAAAVAAREQPPPPTVPGPRRPCSERFPGFAQSRSPESATIDEHARDDYLDKPAAASACREDPSSQQCEWYEQYWPTFSSTARRVVRDGSFEARASNEPSQRSEAVLMGVGDGMVVSVGVSRNRASARVEGEALILESIAQLDDVCVMTTNTGCTLEIDSMRQEARITKRPGEPATRDARTTFVGVRGAGVARDITADDLRADQAAIDLGGYLNLRMVSRTGTCANESDGSVVVADAGGLRLGGSGGEGQQGGSITIGGACALARLELSEFEVPVFRPDAGDVGVPPRTLVIPGAPIPTTPPPSGTGPAAPALGAPQVVSKPVVRVLFRDPIAWRTAPYWGSALGALALASGLGYRFRRAPLVAPAAVAIDRFARQFLRG